MAEKNLTTRIVELREALEDSPLDFAGTFSHSMNNLIAGIMGYSDIIKMGLDNGNASDLKNLEALTAISDAGKQITRKNNDLTSAAKLLYSESKYDNGFTPEVFYGSTFQSIGKEYGELAENLKKKVLALDMQGEDAEIIRSQLTILLEFLEYGNRLLEVTEYDSGVKKAVVTAPELKPGEGDREYESGNKEGCKLVILDDDHSVLAMYSRVSTDKNVAYYSTSSQEAAMGAILEQNPQRVLSDFRMPGMNGVDVAKRLRSQGYKGEIYIVTGDRLEDVTGIEGIGQLNVSVVAKPFTSQDAKAIFEFSN